VVRRFLSIALFITALTSAALAYQSNSGTISGTVTDPSGALIPGASVEIANHVSGYTRTAKTDSSGQFRFYNVPFNPYHMTITASGFSPAARQVEINAIVPVVV